MSDIVSFEDLTSIDQIEAQSAGLIRIVLEGQDDAKLFSDFWFTDNQDRFTFVAANRLPEGSGGSSGVIAAVRKSRDEGILAFGIIDRDTLFKSRCWIGLYEPDAALLHQHAFDAHVYTSQLWEVEAYVLDGTRLRDWVEGSHRNPPASPQLCDAALGTTLSECELLLRLAPAYAALHVAGCSPPGAFTQGQGHAAAELACAAQLQSVDLRHQVVADIVRDLVDGVMAAAPPDAEERLSWYLRYVDTKRLFTRLHKALDLSGGANHWQLAVAMKRVGAKPQELQDQLDQLSLAA